MRNRHLIHLCSVLVAALAMAASTGERTVGSVSFYIGDVRWRTGEGPWQQARLELPLTAAHELRTGPESRAELKLGSSVVRLGEQSLVRLADLAVHEGAAEGGLQLVIGRIWSRLRGLGEGGLEVRSPTAVMAVRGTTFRAEAEADSSLALWVYEGRVDTGPPRGGQVGSTPAAGSSGGAPVPVQGAPRPVPGPYEITLAEWVQVVQGQLLRLRADGRYAVEPFDPEGDRQEDWVRWNLERDAHFDD
ncbi:MAG: FecR domain-containing protein [bacterium]|jgi:hypothetical protein|nr:FecR domain-containing protein [bacterium]